MAHDSLGEKDHDNDKDRSIDQHAVLGNGTELFRPISQYRMLIYGAVLVVIMVLRPEGIMGNREFLSWVKAPFRRRA